MTPRRPGGGRKILDPSGAKRKTRSIVVTEMELGKVKAFLVELRRLKK